MLKIISFTFIKSNCGISWLKVTQEFSELQRPQDLLKSMEYMLQADTKPLISPQYLLYLESTLVWGIHELPNLSGENLIKIQNRLSGIKYKNWTWSCIKFQICDHRVWMNWNKLKPFSQTWVTNNEANFKKTWIYKMDFKFHFFLFFFLNFNWEKHINRAYIWHLLSIHYPNILCKSYIDIGISAQIYPSLCVKSI